MLTETKFDIFTVIEKAKSAEAEAPGFLSEQETESVRKLHRGIPAYEETALVSLSSFASRCGVKAVLVKDESSRFKLKAFKGLGGVYAIFRIVCEKLGLDPEKVSYTELMREKYRPLIADMVFITTTDGNHGKGVSWAAGLLGCCSYVYMPKNSAEARAQAIRDAGNAVVTISELGYDDCVRYTAALAEENGWYLVQDTSWEGYEKIPAWIAQGYTTLFYEAAEQMREMGIERPTHIFLQAGVGAMAGAIAGAAVCTYSDEVPFISVVEPEEAACIYESVKRGDGAPHRAEGSEETIMAGLNCSEPCPVTWHILRDYTRCCFSCRDSVSAHGMRFYAKPEGEDRAIVSGESGAVTGGLVSLLLTDERYGSLRERMGLNENAVVLLINTEGDTDPEAYINIVENGAYPLEGFAAERTCNG